MWLATGMTKWEVIEYESRHTDLLYDIAGATNYNCRNTILFQVPS
jgi:hypothetical protein